MSRLFRRAASAVAADPEPEVDPELLATRDRLTERYAVLQSHLGGLFYEMAIRDAVRMDVLTAKAAELQRVDAELGQVERLLRSRETGITGRCPSCDAAQARAAAFCWQCGTVIAS